MCWDSVTSGLGGRHIYFRYNATAGDIVDSNRHLCCLLLYLWLWHHWTAGPRKHGRSRWNFVRRCPRTRNRLIDRLDGVIWCRRREIKFDIVQTVSSLPLYLCVSTRPINRPIVTLMPVSWAKLNWRQPPPPHAAVAGQHLVGAWACTVCFQQGVSDLTTQCLWNDTVLKGCVYYLQLSGCKN